MMMEEEEETIFDQENLLAHKEGEGNERVVWLRRVRKTAALSMAFFCLGLCLAIPGPTLLDLGARVGGNTEHMSYIFTARSVGYLIGSVVGGILFDFFDQQILLFYTLATTALATAGIPWCSALLALSLLICMQGVAIGVLDTGGNVYCIKIWGKKSAPYMQLLHFSFGIGAFLAPLMAGPFILNYDPAFLYNLTQGGSHPVNFHVPDWSDDIRFVRNVPDLTDLQTVERQKIEVSGRDINFNIFQLNFKRAPRDATNDTDIPPMLEFFNNSSESNVTNVTLEATLLPVTTSTTERPHKPTHLNPEVLSKEHADSEINSGKIKVLLKNKPQSEDEHVAVTVSPTTLILKTTSFLYTNITDDGEAGFSINETASTSNGTQEDPSPTRETQATPNPTLAAGEATKLALVTELPSSSLSTGTSTTSSTTVTTTTTASTTVPLTTSSVLMPPTSPDKTVSPQNDPTITQTPKYNSKPSAAVDEVFVNTTNGTRAEDMHENMIRLFYEKIQNVSKIQFVYFTIGLLLAINAVAFLVLYCNDQGIKYPLYSVSHEDLTRKPHSRFYKITILGLLFFFFLAYVGMEVTFGGLITTFAVGNPETNFTPSQGAALAALFWGCLALGRGISIFIARFFKPPCMIVTNLCLTVLGSIFLSFWISAGPGMLWAGTVLFGLGMSSIYPTAISWANDYYTLTGKATAVFVAGSGIGEMTIPILTGYLYENVNRMSLMYMTLVLSAVLCLLYLNLQFVACRRSKSGNRRSRSGFMRLENSEERADALDMDDIGMTDVGVTGFSENLRRRDVNGGEEDKRKQNGGFYEDSEFTKLVELSD
ncbi:unnamed protein product [Lymnaea stagnalis]|uniref:Sodium-dependent glucose transporter 1 n=1 Tax=Lymnaea stagnalis TaxID=6523 RepID=A0AAV2HC46_LYMST